jgi:uncharacterized protein YcbX
MRTLVGHVESIARYPVKSMAGEALTRAELGYHGIEGDRRLAFRRRLERGGFPWLTAGRVPELLLYQPLGQPLGQPVAEAGALPTRVRTPDGRELDLAGDELREELAARAGQDVELMRMNQGVFDEAGLSLIATATTAAVEAAVGRPLDLRRFRPNVVVRTVDGVAFGDDRWVGAVLTFGDAGPAVAVTQRDPRCAMINIDPETAEIDAAVMKAMVRLNDNNAGVYASVVRTGSIAVGDPLFAAAF